MGVYVCKCVGVYTVLVGVCVCVSVCVHVCVRLCVRTPLTKRKSAQTIRNTKVFIYETMIEIPGLSG